jgi:hypothetical protein
MNKEYLDSVSSAIEAFNSKVSDPDANLFITIAYDRTYKQSRNAIMFVNTGLISALLHFQTFPVPTLRNGGFIMDMGGVSSMPDMTIP